MKISDQVNSIEQGQRLFELGILCRQSLYFHVNYRGKWNVWTEDVFVWNAMDDVYSAFTVAELGVMLPCYYYSTKNAYPTGQFGMSHTIDDVCKSFVDDTDQYLLGASNTEAQARAAMLIYLLENNHITASDCNQRLMK